MHKNYPKDFATMLRGVAAKLDSGEWTLHNSWHDVSADPRAQQSVSFTIEPAKAGQPAATETAAADDPYDPWTRGQVFSTGNVERPSCCGHGCVDCQSPASQPSKGAP